MSSSVDSISPDIARSIAAAIRAGVYPHVASEAVGLSRESFDEAMRLGTQSGASAKAREFASQMRQAIAQARMKAEMFVMAKDPTAWLKHGPGKASESNPGWTNPVKPMLDDDTNAIAAGGAELLELSAEILKALEPFPDARSAVVRVLVAAGLSGERDAKASEFVDAPTERLPDLLAE